MQTPNNDAGRLTELVMFALKSADVLKPDVPNFPANYKRAYSTVLSVVQRHHKRTEILSRTISPALTPALRKQLGF